MKARAPSPQAATFRRCDPSQAPALERERLVCSRRHSRGRLSSLAGGRAGSTGRPASPSDSLLTLSRFQEDVALHKPQAASRAGFLRGAFSGGGGGNCPNLRRQRAEARRFVFYCARLQSHLRHFMAIASSGFAGAPPPSRRNESASPLNKGASRQLIGEFSRPKIARTLVQSNRTCGSGARTFGLLHNARAICRLGGRFLC